MSMNYATDLYTSRPKDVTSLDDDLSSSRLQKYHKLVEVVKPWIAKYLGDDGQLLHQKQSKGPDFIDALKDGVILCQLVNALEQNYNNSSIQIKYKDSSIAFMQMENISFFLDYCVKIGVPQDELFQTVDLFEAKDPYQIMLTIQALSRCLNKRYPQVDIIGPKLANKPPVPKKPSHLKQSSVPVSSKNPNWSTVEYGRINKDSETISYGANRNIIRHNNN